MSRWSAAGLLLAVITAAVWWGWSTSTRPAARRTPVLLLAVSPSATTSPSAQRLQQRAMESWQRAGGAGVPSDRLDATLRLLRAPTDQPLSPDQAMAVAERMGAVDAVAAMSTTGVAPRLALDVLVWTGDASGRELLRLRREVDTDAALWTAVDEALRNVHRLTVGTSSPPRAAFLPVTTASMVPLHRYERG